MHTAERPGDVRRHCADVTKLTGILGHAPTALSDDALATTIDWYRGVLA